MHWFVVQTVLPFAACCYSSPYFAIAANEPFTHRLTSAFRNKVDNMIIESRLCYLKIL